MFFTIFVRQYFFKSFYLKSVYVLLWKFVFQMYPFIVSFGPENLYKLLQRGILKNLSTCVLGKIIVAHFMVQGLDHTHGHLNRYLFLLIFVTSNGYANILKGSNENIGLGRERSISLLDGIKWVVENLSKKMNSTISVSVLFLVPISLNVYNKSSNNAYQPQGFTTQCTSHSGTNCPCCSLFSISSQIDLVSSHFLPEVFSQWRRNAHNTTIVRYHARRLHNFNYSMTTSSIITYTICKTWLTPCMLEAGYVTWNG